MEEKTKEIELVIRGVNEKLEIRQLTFGEYHDIMREVTQTTVSTSGKPNVQMDFGKMQELVILKCLVKAPFEISLANIKKLPRADGERLYNEINQYNIIPELEKETSDGQ
ncbi:MAG: hypothetical protein ACE5FT_05550 [Candidatus Nanoarchaeia archaeon]